MASEYLGLNFGQQRALSNSFVVQNGTSTNSTDFELRVNLAAGATRKDVIEFMRVIEKYLLDATVNGQTAIQP